MSKRKFNKVAPVGTHENRVFNWEKSSFSKIAK